MFRFTTLSSLALAVSSGPAWADVSSETVQSLSAPDSIDTRIGTLDFKDGVPSEATAQTVYDTLDFTNALTVYNNSSAAPRR